MSESAASSESRRLALELAVKLADMMLSKGAIKPITEVEVVKVANLFYAFLKDEEVGK